MEPLINGFSPLTLSHHTTAEIIQDIEGKNSRESAKGPLSIIIIDIETTIDPPTPFLSALLLYSAAWLSYIIHH
jgi:hypothetical protein